MDRSRNKFNLDPSVLAHKTVDLTGEVTINEGCVIGPKCKIWAKFGPIEIGKNCIIEESVIIFNGTKELMKIGDFNHFQVASKVESISVGDWNVFEPKSRTPSTILISNFCKIGAACTILPNPTFSTTAKSAMEIDSSSTGEIDRELLPEGTVVYGIDSIRRGWSGEGKAAMQELFEKHIAYLRVIPGSEIVPFSHHGL